jgi:26S proteasome regulatory subunit N2
MASLGVVYTSHITEAMQLLEPYLPATPTEGGSSTVPSTGGYAEGGALCAMGLIHGDGQSGAAERAATSTSVVLRAHLRASHANTVVSHGAALGIGLVAMGSADLTVLQELKDVLDTDSTVAGEAAGLAMGLVLVGTGAGNAFEQKAYL